jgi:hypothetical protein
VTEPNVKLPPLFRAQLPPGSRSPEKPKTKTRRTTQNNIRQIQGAPMAPSVHWNARHRRQRTRPMIYELTKMSARRVPQPFVVVHSKRAHLHNSQTNRFQTNSLTWPMSGGKKVLPIWSKVGDLIINAFVAESSGKGRADAKNNSI